jgi:hypothetical protein
MGGGTRSRKTDANMQCRKYGCVEDEPVLAATDL